MNFFFFNLFSRPELFFTVVLSVGVSVCIHEFCHAYIALKMGDPTAAQTGHLTLNPLKQMGWFSLIMLLLLGFCWGAVPVNPGNLTRRGRIAVSLAGPGANLLLFVLGIIVSVLVFKVLDSKEIGSVFVIFAQLNLVLFGINIMPVPGFDGGTVLMEFVSPAKLYSSEVGKGFMIGSVLLLFYLVDYIFAAANFLTGEALSLIWSFCK